MIRKVADFRKDYASAVSPAYLLHSASDDAMLRSRRPGLDARALDRRTVVLRDARSGAMVLVGTILIGIAAAAIIFIGVRFWLQPEAAGRAFGLTTVLTDRQRAYYDIKGVRDVVSELVVLVPIALGLPRVVATLALVAAITPAVDCAIVLRNGGTKAAAFGIHAATAIYLVIAATLILLKQS